MKEWLTLNRSMFNTPKEATLDGVTVQVAVSPYDVPEAVRGYYDENSQRFVIEFRYIGGPEPTRSVAVEQQVDALVGQNSGRLFQIRLNAQALGAQAVKLEMLKSEADEAISELGRSEQQPNRLRNYAIAKKVLSSKRFAGRFENEPLGVPQSDRTQVVGCRLAH